ncbi:DUF4365 domain-containing protein [Pedobacter ureilyticus]|uniref:DUF4365 domain-containing protein n=1 Tax=Pedobacter ureilyticus TaxID=1393051 RepID=A0ABW9J854_9SPHI|nr:DUF4365 domain-containing protein [Pedobacter helvus]
MAINDLPQVDGASMNEDRSKNRLLSYFSRNAGFIAHEQTQDFGVDYKVELIAQGATNWAFDIQLKSVEKPKIILEGKYLSFSIKASTLNYLLRNDPVYGLLVIYDLGSNNLFFDYIDVLYLRLLEEREGISWGGNESLGVRIPTVNVIDTFKIAEIHNKFLQRFKNRVEMNSAHGANYGLPSIGVGHIKGLGFGSIEDAVTELRTKGAILLAQRDLWRVYELLEKLPRNQIVSDKEVLLVAAMAYNGVGKLADSTYYIERLSKKYALNESEQRSITFTSLKNKLGSGEIDRKTFVADAKLLLPSAGVSEELSLRLNILYFELGKIQGFERMSAELVAEFEELERMIAKVEDISQRNYLKATNLDNLAVIVSNERTEGMNRKVVFDQLGMKMEESQRQHYVDKDHMLHHWLNSGYVEIGRYALANNEFVLLAMVTSSSLKFWLNFQMDVLVFGEKGISREKTKLELKERIDIALETAKMLDVQKFLRQSYVLQCLAYELIFVSREWYEFEDSFNLGDIKDKMQRLEEEFELPTFVSQMEMLINIKRSGKHHGFSGVGSMVGMSDGQIRTYASYILESRYYPNAKLENILAEMYAFRNFHQRNDDNRFVLRILRPADRNLAYTFTHQFYAMDQKTGIQSLPSNDIDGILQSFGI